MARNVSASQAPPLPLPCDTKAKRTPITAMTLTTVNQRETRFLRVLMLLVCLSVLPLFHRFFSLAGYGVMGIDGFTESGGVSGILGMGRYPGVAVVALPH